MMDEMEKRELDGAQKIEDETPVQGAQEDKAPESGSQTGEKAGAQEDGAGNDEAAQNGAQEDGAGDETVQAEEQESQAGQTGEQADSEAQEEADSESEEEEDDEENDSLPEDLKKYLKLVYRVPLDVYVDFNRIFMVQNVKKAKKRTIILGVIEVIMGVAFLIAMLMGKVHSGLIYYVITFLLIAMGLYGMLYYKLLFEKSLRKTVKKHYEQNDYFQHDVIVKLYPNRFIEQSGEYKNVVYWYNIHEIREAENMFMIVFGDHRCLLIPKSEIPGQLQELNQRLEKVCTDFEKPRIKI